MPTNYTGTPLESDWEKLQQRRAINNAIVQQSMAPYRGTESAVGGRSVDNRWGSGISKIGQALVGAYGNKKLREDSAALGEKYDTGRTAAMEEVMEALREQGNAGPYGPQVPKKSDPKKAAMKLLNPYLQGNNDVARALINSEAYRSGGGNRQHYTYQPLEGGGLARLPGRPGEDPSMVSIDGSPARAAKWDPNTRFNANLGHTLGGNTAEMNPRVGVGPQASAAEAGRQGRLNQPPLTPAEESAEKLKAESTEKRAFNMEGVTHLLDLAENTLKTGNPTSSGIGAGVDWLARQFGVTLEGATAAADLEVIGGALTGKMPRFEGPQSDYDREYYQQMAGKLGDRRVPEKERLSALKIVRQIWSQYEGKGYITSDEMQRIRGGSSSNSTGTVDRAPLSADKEARFRERLKREQAQ